VSVRVGTSGYNYAEWKGSFYPEALAAAKMLPYYAARFPTVEINATFYRMPTAKTLAGWAAATPDAFVLALKAPQRLTHFARLRNVDEPLRVFCDTARTLGAKLGPLLFQLPPNFKKDADRLAETLFQLPPDLRCAFEFRHESWLAEDVYDLLRRRNAALCVADSETASTPLVATADFGYLRLRDEGYTDADLARWARTIAELTDRWRDAFVYFKHEESGTGPAFARRLTELLAAKVV
jgi:uncharacterized protein YecE (DUF72 family)